jgi:O-antigen/teichoic acid export membrane protein
MMFDTLNKWITGCIHYSNSVKSEILHAISNDPLIKGILILGSGTAVSQVIGIFLLPIITRIYPPAIYGTLAVFISLLSILVNVSAFRYELAIPIPEKDEDAESLLILSLLIVCILSIALLVILLIFGDSLAGVFHFEFMKPDYWLFCIGLWCLSVYNILTLFAIRSKNYIRITHTRILQSVSNSVSKIGLGLLSFGSFGLICGEIIGSLVGIGTLARTFLPTLLHSIKNVSINTMRINAKKFKKFPLYSFPASFINDLSLQAPVLLLSVLFGFHIVGLYSMSYAILVYPVSILAGSIAQVHFGEISELFRKKSPEILGLYLKTTKRLFLFGAPLILFGAIVSPIVFPVLLGPSWGEAGIFFLPLSIMVIAQFVIGSTDRLELYGYNHWELIWNISRTVLVISGFFLAYLLHLSAIETILIYSFIMTMMYVVSYILNIEVLKQIVIKNEVKAGDNKQV